MAFMASFSYAHRAVFFRRASMLAGMLAAVFCITGTGAFAAEPVPWQMGLQPPAGSIAEMADDLHNLLLVVITLISLFVLGLLVYVGPHTQVTRGLSLIHI